MAGNYTREESARGWKEYGADTLRDEVRRGGRDFVRGAVRRGIQYGTDAVFGKPRTLTGAEIGDYNREAQEAQYPGTNPWERLGAPGAPGGAIEISKQERSNKRKIASEQIDQQQRSSAIQGRAAGIQAGANFGPDKAMAIANFVVTGDKPAESLGLSAQKETSRAAGQTGRSRVSEAYTAVQKQLTNEFKAKTERYMYKLRSKEYYLNIGKATGDPLTAVLMALSTRAYLGGISRADLDEVMDENWKGMVQGGAAVKAVSALSKFLNLHIGRLFSSGVGRRRKGFQGPVRGKPSKIDPAARFMEGAPRK